MRYSTLITAVCVGGAFASPIEKRDYVTDLTVVTKTVYVTAQGGAPTPQPEIVNNPPAIENNRPPWWQWPKKPTIVYPPRPTYKPAPPAPKPEPPAETSQAPPPPPPAYTTVAPPPPPPAYTTVQPPPPPVKTQPATPPAGDDYKGTVLYHHNIHRSNHSAEALTWDDHLADSARKLAETCVYEHDTSYNGGGYGQNIGYQGGYSNFGAMLTNAMYNDEAPLFENLYGQANPSGGFSGWGHFTQIVWKGTKRVACHTARCPSLRVASSGQTVNNANFIVCNYGPPGNYGGEYAKNVARPLGHKMISI